jgi:hypothetical protein
MAQVYGAGGKTHPKKGRLGTGAYYPSGTPLYIHNGNVFPGIHVERPQFPQTTFGDPSRAGIATVVGQNRVMSLALHPNKAQYNTITLPLAPAMVVSSSGDNNNHQPIAPSQSILTMPHERNTNSASGTRKKGLAFKTTFGAGQSMPTDSAFRHNPGAMYTHKTKPKPGPAHEAVKVSVPNRTIARVPKPLPVSGGLRSAPNRTPPPSFVSRSNMWYDPNNSFVQGRVSAGGGGTGTGRWGVVKRGVV